jgi:hypothetical protein
MFLTPVSLYRLKITLYINETARLCCSFLIFNFWKIVEFSVRTSRQRRLPILDVIIFFLSIGYAGGVVSTADELQHQQTGAEEQPPGGLGRAELVRQHDEGAAQHEVHDENDNGDPLRSVQTARRKWIAHIILFVCFFFFGRPCRFVLEPRLQFESEQHDANGSRRRSPFLLPQSSSRRQFRNRRRSAAPAHRQSSRAHQEHREYQPLAPPRATNRYFFVSHVRVVAIK